MLNNSPIVPFTEDELISLKKQARRVFSQKAGFFAEKIGVKYGKLFIRSQVSRWGSCSSLVNLNFNCVLMLCPDEIIDYIVIHELCHLKFMNHSRSFWSEVEKFCPEYKVSRKWLKENGSELIRRLRAANARKQVKMPSARERKTVL